MQDRRYGKYPVEATYDGGDQFAAAHAVTTVDFGPLPEISLPSEGVLITPYPTASIAVPFLIFYGTMWVDFFLRRLCDDLALAQDPQAPGSRRRRSLVERIA